MSSHRETPASSLLARASLLTAARSAALVGQPEHADPTTAISLHVNLNITDFFVFQKPENPGKTIFIMNVNPMPPRLADSFDATASYEFLVDTNADAVADIAFRVTFSPLTNGQQVATVRLSEGADAASKGIGGRIIIQPTLRKSGWQ